MSNIFFVIGSENSGTRITTKLLIEAGCFGDFSHTQRLDLCFPPHHYRGKPIREVAGDAENIVFRQSIPHGAYLPDAHHLFGIGIAQGYICKVIITIRDPDILLKSKVDSGYVKERAIKDIETARLLIGGWVSVLQPSNLLIFLTSVMFKYPEAGVGLLRNYTKLDFSKVDVGQIYDADKKYEEGGLH